LEASSDALKDFRGVARLFPLPNLVLFPHAVAPLHIFEPRYVAMMEDALAGDQLIAMALLLPGWEPDYEGRPPVAPVACVGRIATHVRLPDGRYNLLLAGLQRAAIRRELPPKRPFREAQVELLEDCYSAAGAELRTTYRDELRDIFLRRLPPATAAREQFDQMMSRSLPLGTLVDVVAYAVGWPVEFKQHLLEELDVDRRAALLLDRLRQLDQPPSSPGDDARWTWPPRFSDN
jgi:ATP-dependent Lon protease